MSIEKKLRAKWFRWADVPGKTIELDAADKLAEMRKHISTCLTVFEKQRELQKPNDGICAPRDEFLDKLRDAISNA